MQRLISFDIAKAICMILVVVGHYVPDYSPTWYVDIHDVIYTFHSKYSVNAVLCA